jgi:hypothetical protein
MSWGRSYVPEGGKVAEPIKILLQTRIGPGNRLEGFPQALRQTRRYVRNLALWLAGRESDIQRAT